MTVTTVRVQKYWNDAQKEFALMKVSNDCEWKKLERNEVEEKKVRSLMRMMERFGKEFQDGGKGS
jgi:hypothetical protein